MFASMNQEQIIQRAMECGLGEVEANELAVLSQMRCVDATRHDFERYWQLIEKLGK